MELRETAACGVAHREFTLDLSSAKEIKEFLRLVEAGSSVDAELAAELQGEATNALGAGSVSISLLDTKIAKLQEMMRVAAASGEASPDFIDELASYMQFVVGAA